MASPAYANPAEFFPSSLPGVWGRAVRRSLFGDIALVVFLLAQCFDGVFTYVGVMTFGPGIEANPLIAMLMAAFGHGPALVGAKIVAGLLGIALHLRHVHAAVGLLAGFYVTAAILPWMVILFA